MARKVAMTIVLVRVVCGSPGALMNVGRCLLWLPLGDVDTSLGALPVASGTSPCCGAVLK